MHWHADEASDVLAGLAADGVTLGHPASLPEAAGGLGGAGHSHQRSSGSPSVSRISCDVGPLGSVRSHTKASGTCSCSIVITSSSSAGGTAVGSSPVLVTVFIVWFVPPRVDAPRVPLCHRAPRSAEPNGHFGLWVRYRRT